MPNICVYVTEELHARIKKQQPALKVSQAFAKAMETELGTIENSPRGQRPPNVPPPRTSASVGDVLRHIVIYAGTYRLGALKSIRRNEHMNKHTGTDLAQDDIDAILVDFINYIGALHGVDFALYTSDLYKEAIDE